MVPSAWPKAFADGNADPSDSAESSVLFPQWGRKTARRRLLILTNEGEGVFASRHREKYSEFSFCQAVKIQYGVLSHIPKVAWIVFFIN